MVAIKGHFDGKVIVPDEPLDLPANQRLIVHLQPVPSQHTDFRAWLGIAKRVPTNPSPRFNSDAELWDQPTVVVDTSVILAIYFDEPAGPWAADQLNQNVGQLAMSTVNLAEALIRIQDRQPALADELHRRLLASGIRFVPPDVDQAQIAAHARLTFPLNLGDCFAYALARSEGHPILTLDRDFQNVDVPVVLPPIRPT